MSIAPVLRGSRFFGLVWLMIALGSCSIVQYNIQTKQFTLEEAAVTDTNDCHIFQRPIRLGHQIPKLPSHEVIPTLPLEVINDILLSHAEATHRYLENEERFLAEDIERHRERCEVY